MAQLRWVTYEQFAAHLGEFFDVRTEAGVVVRLELVEATRGSAPGGLGPDGQPRTQFALTFRGAAAAALAQGTYPLSHASLGDLDMFIVPVAAGDDGLRYEAVFA